MMTESGSSDEWLIGEHISYLLDPTRNRVNCACCGQDATHQHIDTLRSIDEPQCDYCCDRNCL